MTEQNMDGQVTMFDLGIWFGKTSSELSPAQTEKISAPSSKKPQESPMWEPLFLDLRTDGQTLGAYWQTDGLSLGEYTTRSFGEYPSVAVESRLSQILEDNPHLKYYLSENACAGILKRAKARNKTLPPELEEALTIQAEQSPSKNAPDVMGGAKGY